MTHQDSEDISPASSKGMMIRSQIQTNPRFRKKWISVERKTTIETQVSDIKMVSGALKKIVQTG